MACSSGIAHSAVEPLLPASGSGVLQPAEPLRHRLRKKTLCQRRAPTAGKSSCVVQPAARSTRTERGVKRNAGCVMHPAGDEEVPWCKRCERKRVPTKRSTLCAGCLAARRVAGGENSAGNTTSGLHRRKIARRAQKRSAMRRSTKVVLVVKNPWLDLILSGKKTWEIRGQHTQRRGKIHLALSGAGGRLFGQCHITESLPLEKGELHKHFTKHQIKDLSVVSYPRPHAWILGKPLRYSKPFVYTHKKGACVWVNL